MSNLEQIKLLNRLRGALKTKLTRFEKFLQRPVIDIDVVELKDKLTETADLKQLFEEKQTKIESLVEDEDIEREYEERGDFEDRLSTACARARRIIDEKEPTTRAFNQSIAPSISQNSTNASGNNFAIDNDHHPINLKLPALNLPSFSGSYENWPGFSDTFKSSVHNDPRFTDSQRLIYLRTCLTGRAADKIEALETTDANYSVAWRILQKYYDDPSAVINNHIKAFFELPSCQNASSTSVGDLLNSVTKHYRALEALNKPFLEAFPIYAITSKLDPQTRLKWKEHTQSSNYPTMEDLLEFLHCREKILEANKVMHKIDRFDKSSIRNDNRSYGINRPPQNRSSSRPTVSYSLQTKIICNICKNTHYTQSCEKLIKATLTERLDMVKNLKLCSNCLRSNHSLEKCTASACKTCNGKHHTLLHQDNSSQKSLNVNFSTLHSTDAARVLLSTAIVHVLDHKGNPHRCRALLDNGSQVNLLTEKMATRLGLKQAEVDIPLGGVNKMTSSVKKLAQTTIQSRLNKYSANLSFLITPEINNSSPSELINRTELKIPVNIRLADPEFHLPGEIDLLIGAEIFLKLLCVGQIVLANNDTVLQKTQFGWILGGKTSGIGPSNISFCNLSLNLLHRKISQFWEIENGPQERVLSTEENLCEQHYVKNTKRNPDTGHYIVKLPFKEKVVELGDSYSRALNRLRSLERSFLKNRDHKEQYCAFMKEYEELGHMTEDKTAFSTDGYFLPHHSVIKQSSITTKLRVVFDASAKTSTGLSLNDSLMVGPNIQEDLFPLLIRFRSHVYAVTADIEKMYRQIELHSDDRKFQKILWRENHDQPVKTFTLNTVTYGTSSASFLATRTLKQLAIDEVDSYPRAAMILKEDFYMDDLLTGASTIEDAKQVVKELIQVTRKCGMNLRQWVSNTSTLVSALSNESDQPYHCLTSENNTKTLGIYWNHNQDILFYTVNPSADNSVVTKRSILSQIAQLFDPLGLLGPIIVQAKIIMQALWLLKLDWDETLPQEIHTTWVEFRNQLPLLRDLIINRKLTTNYYKTIQVHGFSDASERAYGACIYIRSTDETGIHYTELVCSKSRVAPIKKLTLPRLELCAALLLAKLFETVSLALRRLVIEKTILWSDSTIVLHWIKESPHVLETFEGNRVAQIQMLTASCEWRHVRTNDNPADLVSRGLSPREFLNRSFWLNGPLWLRTDEDNWPLSILELVDIPGKRKPKCFINLTYSNDIAAALFKRLGSFSTLKRIVAYCQRFIDIKIHKLDVKGNLSISELKRAHMCVIRLVQHEVFFDEIKTLEKKGVVNGNLVNLNPFLDSEGILRVGGRLRQSDLLYSQKHPILLPKNHNVTNLIIREQHLKLFHAGTQATLNALRNNYWVINGRSVVKNIVLKCVTCCRAKPQTMNYLMGELPKNRTVFERAFLHSGIDYCGPFFIKEKKHRNRVKVKIYTAIFVCFATKAVHIEIVSDLTSEAFLACLKRFFARRGKSSDLYSDNATTFKGAQHEIEDISRFLNNQENTNKIAKVLAEDNINWHFIPPLSPHFGGLWEAAVKSFKHHMVRVVGERLLTYEQFGTYATEIEGILNSRPLTPLSSDPNDLTVLTPGHFLIGNPITSVPEHNLTDLPTGRLSSWQQVQQMKQHFWSRWHKEYLHELTVRKKWHNGSKDIQVGNIVTIRDDNLPPMRWSLGRVIAVKPGKDGIVRVVTVKTVKGEYERSVKNLSPLPIDTNVY